MRLFVAAQLPAPVLDHLDGALAAVRDLPGAPRWTAPALRHLTLAFLGEVPPAPADRLQAGLAAAALGIAPIRLQLAGAGVFPPRGAPRVLWVGLAGPGLPALADAARAVDRVARAARIPTERRPFRPHLTVGRWRPADRAAPAPLLAALADYRGPEFTVQQIALVSSRLGPSPVHEPVAAWPLRGVIDAAR